MSEGGGWLQRLKRGLGRSSAKLGEGITGIFTRRRLDDETLDELEELLIQADMGMPIATEVTGRLRKTRFGQEVTPEEVRASLAEVIVELIEPIAKPLRIDRALKPHVILVVGVNGSGKTTTIGKLAKQYRDAGMAVHLAAGLAVLLYACIAAGPRLSLERRCITLDVTAWYWHFMAVMWLYVLLVLRLMD